MFLPSNITLKFGDSGDFVSELQRRLALVRCFSSDQVNGFYDGATVNGVSSFQGMNGLRSDGVAGPETLRRLNGVIAGGSSGDTETSTNEEEEKKIADEQRFMNYALASQQPVDPFLTHAAIGDAPVTAPEQHAPNAQPPHLADPYAIVAAATAATAQQPSPLDMTERAMLEQQRAAMPPVTTINDLTALLANNERPTPATEATPPQFGQRLAEPSQNPAAAMAASPTEQTTAAPPQFGARPTTPPVLATTPQEIPPATAEPVAAGFAQFGQRTAPAPVGEQQQPVISAVAAAVSSNAAPALPQFGQRPIIATPPLQADPTAFRADIPLTTTPAPQAQLPQQQPAIAPQPAISQPQAIAAVAAPPASATAEPAQAAAASEQPSGGLLQKASRFANSAVQRIADYIETKLPPAVLREVQETGQRMAQAGMREAPIPTGPDNIRAPEQLPARGPEQQPQQLR